MSQHRMLVRTTVLFGHRHPEGTIPTAFIGLLIALLCTVGRVAAAELPIFDAHLHYSHDAWENLPPKDAVAILRKAGVQRALVSSSGDEGTQRLVEQAPDLVLPSLRPYRRRSDASTWVRDDTVVAFLEERLARSRYVAIGEFHVYGADADLPVPKRMVALAKQNKLVLHAHTDVDGLERLFRQDKDARILWAHSGFERPEQVRDMLRKYPNLWCDLAFRNEHGVAGKVPAEWRAVFTQFPDRFMVGTDTFTPERWHYVVEHAQWSRAWLADLPPALAERIAWRNGDALFAGWTPPSGR
ncbi:MAG: amidohydrolase family protein [Betaproteobacteria bacterium]